MFNRQTVKPVTWVQELPAQVHLAAMVQFDRIFGCQSVADQGLNIEINLEDGIGDWLESRMFGHTLV